MHDAVKEFKRDFNINNIVGLMMLHYFKWPWCLEDLANYDDEIYLLLHYSPEFKSEWPKKIPKVKNIIEININNEWQVMEWRAHEGEFRENILRMLDNIKPDIVFFPDEDESYPEPELLINDLRKFYTSNKKQLAFKRCNFWDSMDMVRKDKWIYYGPHIKIYKWQPNLTYIPHIGWNKLTTYGKKRMVSKSIIKHYAYMEKAERERRYHELYKEKQDTFKGLLEKPKLVKYTNALKAPRT